jgi:hypothetical protein
MARQLLPHSLSCILGLLSIVLFWCPLRQLLSLSPNDQRYSHIILIPVISAFVMYLERRKIFSRIPNPHAEDIGRGLLVRILRQAGIERKEWEAL